MKIQYKITTVAFAVAITCTATICTGITMFVPGPGEYFAGETRNADSSIASISGQDVIVYPDPSSLVGYGLVEDGQLQAGMQDQDTLEDDETKRSAEVPLEKGMAPVDRVKVE